MFHAPAVGLKNAEHRRHEKGTRKSTAQIALPRAVAPGNQMSLGIRAGASTSTSRPVLGSLQRKCATCGEEEKKLQTKPLVGELADAQEREADNVADGMLQASPGTTSRATPQSLLRVSSTAVAPTGVPQIVHDVLRSRGQILDTQTRNFFEPRFGADFGAVRIHTDARAAQSAAKVKAQAYTVGPDIVFASGRYAPHTDAGRHLLAHELTHVVQQEGAHQAPVHRAVADEVAADTGSQSPDGDPSSKLSDLIATVEQTRAAASTKVVAKAGEDGVDADSLAETQKYIIGLGALLEQLRLVASGSDDSKKQHVLEEFSHEKLSTAEDRLSSTARSSAAPVKVQQPPDQALATMPTEISHPQSAAEVEADRVASQIMAGGPASIRQPAPQSAIHRQGEWALAAGGSLLAFEASGPGEVEAAVPVVGWIALGATLLVAGGLIAYGTMMSSSNSGTRTRTQTRAQPRTTPRPDGDCNAMMTACMLTSMADLPGSVFGQSRCLFCAEVCQREGGVWPSTAPTTTGRVRCDFWNFRGTE